MDLSHSIVHLKSKLKPHYGAGKTIGLVPTMGNLHDGHMCLVQESLKDNDCTVVSIFINPLQFNPDEDLATYPKTLDEDTKKLRESGCHYVFIPDTQEIYQGNIDSHTQVYVPGLSKLLCGKTRPGHFEGVATIVNKLLNIVRPHNAYFGLKDYQQFLIVKRMVSDLQIGTRIVGLDTIRDPGGLALSSRNSFLSELEIQKARQLYSSLKQVASALDQGESNFLDLEKQAYNRLTVAGLNPDYFSICNSETLMPATAADLDIVILAAAYLGSVRLIDNLHVSLAPQTQATQVIE